MVAVVVASVRGACLSSWQDGQGESEPAPVLWLRGQSLLLGPAGPMKPAFQLPSEWLVCAPRSSTGTFSVSIL